MRDLLLRLLAFEPHLWPSVSRKAAWEQFMRDVKQETERR